jgi:uncharacterized damage-inducible protein DinB
MDEKALFTRFWVKESKLTRNVLARIPEGSVYRPDPKSRTAQEIAWQIFSEENLIIEALEQATNSGWSPPPMPGSMQQVLAAYDEQATTLEARWNSLPEEHWDRTILFFGGIRLASVMAWSFLFDIVHHRGQITTYLRPIGSTVPQVYGPSADEP